MTRRRPRRELLAATIADEVVRSLGPLAPPRRIVREVEARCDAAGVQVPSPHSIRARIAYHALWAEDEPGRGLRLVIDQARLHLAVSVGNAAVHPLLTLAFLDPRGIVVAHRIDLPTAAPASCAARLIPAIPSDDRALPIVMRTPATAAGGWPALRDALVAADVDLAGPSTLPGLAGIDVSAAFGSRLDGLRIGRAPRREPKSAVADWSTGESLVDETVRAHNAQRSHPVPPFSVTRRGLAAVADHL